MCGQRPHIVIGLYSFSTSFQFNEDSIHSAHIVYPSNGTLSSSLLMMITTRAWAFGAYGAMRACTSSQPMIAWDILRVRTSIEKYAKRNTLSLYPINSDLTACTVRICEGRISLDKKVLNIFPQKRSHSTVIFQTITKTNLLAHKQIYNKTWNKLVISFRLWTFTIYPL